MFYDSVCVIYNFITNTFKLNPTSGVFKSYYVCSETKKPRLLLSFSYNHSNIMSAYVHSGVGKNIFYMFSI